MFYFVLPLPLEYRQTLAVLVFSPIAAAAPAFTGDLKGDIGLAMCSKFYFYYYQYDHDHNCTYFCTVNKNVEQFCESRLDF